MPHTAAFISVKAVDGVNGREFSFGSKSVTEGCARRRRVLPRNRTPIGDPERLR